MRHPTRPVFFLLLALGLAACGSSLPLSGTQPTITAQTPLPQAHLTDWTMYHRDAQRSGYLATFPDPGHLNHAWSATLDGAVYGEPLSVNGHVIVATEGDSLYALDARTGNPLWRTNVGTPVPQRTLPCGNIDPLGITGTPVYDPATGLVFAVAEVSGPSHVLVGVDVQTGQVKWRRVIDPPGIHVATHQQRGALALDQNRVYITFGGLNGDCGQYQGWVIGAPTSGQGALVTFEVPTEREGGIWAPSGPSVDGAGNLYVSVGNGAATGGTWDKTDAVLRLSPALQLLDAFAPTSWPQDNASDADLGSMGPVLLPNGWLLADGKSGQTYLLQQNALGGVGGEQLQQNTNCRAFGGAAVVGSVAYVPCTAGVLALQVQNGPQMTKLWQVPAAGSPVVGGHTLYTLDTSAGMLVAYNAATGAQRAAISVGAVSRFATPMLAGDAVYIGTLNGVVAIGVTA
jgi:outer membrane protein assembly factor BamB